MNTQSQRERTTMFDVLIEIVNNDSSDFVIINNHTDEIRILRECVLFDIDVFDEHDFYNECEVFS